MYRSVLQETLGSGWTTDFPAADRILMIPISDSTLAEVTTSESDEPLLAIVRATDESTFQCPFVFASDVGTIEFLPDEVVGPREYLLKGGFLRVGDFRGQAEFDRWPSEISRVLPGRPIVQMPLDHALFRTFYEVREVPRIPAISFWMQQRHTVERGGSVARLFGIFDERGHLLVLMSHDIDIADGRDCEGENQFFETFSP